MDEENLAEKIKREYFEVTRNEIVEFWKEKSQSQEKSRYIKDPANHAFPQPWFGDYSVELKIFEERIKRSPILRLWDSFPASFRQEPLRFIDEMGFLLPRSEHTKAFLPVLIISYAANRRRQCNSTEDVLSQYSYIFTSIYCGAFFPNKKELERQRNRFILQPFKEKYKRLDVNLITIYSYTRILHPFSVVILFLHLLLYTRDICNVTLSFYLFELMTNTLSLFGADAKKILSSLEHSRNFSLEDDIKEDICKFAQEILDQTCPVSVWNTLDPDIRIAENYHFLHESIKKIMRLPIDNKIGSELNRLIFNLSNIGEMLNEGRATLEIDTSLQQLVDLNMKFFKKNHINIPIPSKNYPTPQSQSLMKFICGLHDMPKTTVTPKKPGMGTDKIIEAQIKEFDALRSKFLSGKLAPISKDIDFDSK